MQRSTYLSQQYHQEQPGVIDRRDIQVGSNISAYNTWDQESLPKSSPPEIWEGSSHRPDLDEDYYHDTKLSAEIVKEDPEYAQSDLVDLAEESNTSDEENIEADIAHADTLLDKRSPPLDRNQQSTSTSSATLNPSSRFHPEPHQFQAPHTFPPPHQFRSEHSHALGEHSFLAASPNFRPASGNFAIERHHINRRVLKSDSASSIDGRRIRFREGSTRPESSRYSATLPSRIHGRHVGANSDFVKRDLATHDRIKERSSSPITVLSQPSLEARGDRENDPNTPSLSPIQETSHREVSSSGARYQESAPGISLPAVSTGRTTYSGDDQRDAAATPSALRTQLSIPRSPGRRVSFNIPSSPVGGSPSPPRTPLRSKSGEVEHKLEGMLQDGRTKYRKPESPTQSQATEQSPGQPSPPRDRSRTSSTHASPQRSSGSSRRLHRRTNHDDVSDHFSISRRSLYEVSSLRPRTSSPSGQGSGQGSASPTSSQAENEMRQMSLDGPGAGSGSAPHSQLGSPDIQSLPPRFRPGVERPPPQRSRIYRTQSMPRPQQGINPPARTQRSNTLQFLVDLARNAEYERSPSVSPPRSSPAGVPMSYYARPGMQHRWRAPGRVHGGYPTHQPAASQSRLSRIDEQWPQLNPDPRARRSDAMSDARYHSQARTASGIRPQASQQQGRYTWRPALNNGNPQRSESFHNAGPSNVRDTANNWQNQNRRISPPGTPQRSQTPSPMTSPKTPRLRRRDLRQAGANTKQNLKIISSQRKAPSTEQPTTRSHFSKRAVSLPRSRSSSTLSPQSDLPHSSSTSSLSTASSSRSGLSSQSSLSQTQSRALGSMTSLLAPTPSTLRRSGSRRTLPFAPMTNALRVGASRTISLLPRPNVHEDTFRVRHNEDHISPSSESVHPNGEAQGANPSQRSWPRISALSSMLRSINPHRSSLPSSEPHSDNDLPPSQTIRSRVDLSHRPIPGSTYDAATSHDSIPIGQAVRPFQVRANSTSGIGRPAIPIGQAVPRAHFGMGFAPDAEDRSVWVRRRIDPSVEVGRSAPAA